MFSFLKKSFGIFLATNIFFVGIVFAAVWGCKGTCLQYGSGTGIPGGSLNVKFLQRTLGIAETGVYDRATRNAVLQFQKDQKLLAKDGVVGDETSKALEKYVADKGKMEEARNATKEIFGSESGERIIDNFKRFQSESVTPAKKEPEVPKEEPRSTIPESPPEEEKIPIKQEPIADPGFEGNDRLPGYTPSEVARLTDKLDANNAVLNQEITRGDNIDRQIQNTRALLSDPELDAPMREVLNNRLADLEAQKEMSTYRSNVLADQSIDLESQIRVREYNPLETDILGSSPRELTFSNVSDIVSRAWNEFLNIPDATIRAWNEAAPKKAADAVPYDLDKIQEEIGQRPTLGDVLDNEGFRSVRESADRFYNNMLNDLPSGDKVANEVLRGELNKSTAISDFVSNLKGPDTYDTYKTALDRLNAECPGGCNYVKDYLNNYINENMVPSSADDLMSRIAFEGADVAKPEQGLQAGFSESYTCLTEDGKTWKAQNGSAVRVNSLVKDGGIGVLQVPEGMTAPKRGQREVQLNSIDGKTKTKQVASKCTLKDGQLVPDPSAKVYKINYTQTDKTNWVTPAK